METSVKNYNMIDVAKIIMAIFVVALHRPIFDDNLSSYNDFLNTVFFNIAVPFFMTVSSFIFFSKCSEYDNPRKYLIKQEKRLIFLYAFWSIVYIPLTLIPSIMNIKDNITIKTIIGEAIIWLKSFIFDTSFVHLWYMNTLIVCIFILYFLRKKLKPEVILIVCILLSLVTGGLSSQRNVLVISGIYFKFVPYILRNVFRKGLICCAFGMYAADRKKDFSCLKSIIAFVSVTAVEIALFLLSKGPETFAEGCVTYLFSSIKAMALFMICKNIKLNDSPVFVKLRGYSSLIYFTHLLFSEIFLDKIIQLKPLRFIPASAGRFLMTVIFASAVSFVIYKLSQTKKFKFLKRIY